MRLLLTVVVNIGNTFSRAELWNGKYFEPLFRIETARFDPNALPEGVPVVAATVIPEVKRRPGAEKIHFIDARECGTFVDFTQIDCSTLGADRVANAIALAEFYELPAIAVDCGTAITLEIVDEERVFRGGAIAPGRRLMRRALATGTAQLPEIPFSAKLPEQAGNGTVESIRFGIDRGAVGLVRELVQVAAAPFGGVEKVRIVATGGDAPYFAAALPFLELAPEEFTHHGIRLAGGVF